MLQLYLIIIRSFRTFWLENTIISIFMEYEWRKDIPNEYDSLYMYGIGIENNLREIVNLQYNIMDSFLTEQMVIVLAKELR